MRSLFVVVVIIGLAGAAWWQKDKLMAYVKPAPAPAQVYRWRDAQGSLHFSTEKPSGTKAELVTLKPLQTMPGMTKEQIDATLHPKPAPGEQAPAKDCEQDDPNEQAKCINAQMNGRNVAIEKMEKKLSGAH